MQKSASERDTVWEGRMVVEERVSHILVLSESPELDDETNRRIEAALHALDAAFAVTVPLAVGDGQPRARKTTEQPTASKR